MASVARSFGRLPTEHLFDAGSSGTGSPWPRAALGWDVGQRAIVHQSGSSFRERLTTPSPASQPPILPTPRHRRIEVRSSTRTSCCPLDASVASLLRPLPQRKTFLTRTLGNRLPLAAGSPRVGRGTKSHRSPERQQLPRTFNDPKSRLSASHPADAAPSTHRGPILNENVLLPAGCLSRFAPSAASPKEDLLDADPREPAPLGRGQP